MSRSDWTTPDLSAASARWNQTDSSMNEEPFSRSAQRLETLFAVSGAPRPPRSGRPFGGEAVVSLRSPGVYAGARVGREGLCSVAKYCVSRRATGLFVASARAR